MLVRDLLKKKEFKGINWSITKEEWPNDRVEMGPFTTKSKDHQDEKVFIGDDRLNYIKTYGRMIYEHHQDPSEPVTILADCLGVGFDKSGQTYGIWGWYEGSETINEKWEESQRYGQGMGYSIGGKRTEVQCNDGHCTLINPEVLEISKTKNPANEDCKVYYINQFAKNIRKTAEKGGNMFEIGTAYKRMNEKFGSRFMVDPSMEVEHALTFPCAKDYYYGMMETGLVNKSEARDLIENELNTIRKNVVNKMKEETATQLIKTMNTFSENIEKVNTLLEKFDESPSGSPYAGGNQVLELLQSMTDTLSMISNKLDGAGSPGGADPMQEQEPPTEEPSPDPPSESDTDPKTLDPPGAGEESEPEDDKEDVDEEDGEDGKKVKKSDTSSNLSEKVDMIRDKFSAKYNSEEKGYSWVECVGTKAIIVEKEGCNYKVGYTIDGDDVKFDAESTWTEVEKKFVAKAEYHSEEPEGENPETMDTEPPEVKEGLNMPEGENPEPEGPNPETVDEPIADLGNAEDDTSVVPDEAEATDEPNASTEIPEETKAPEDIAKNLIKPKKEDENSIKKRLAEKGIIMVRKDNNPTQHPSDQPGELLNTPENETQMTEAKKGIFDQMYESGGDITVPK